MKLFNMYLLFFIKKYKINKLGTCPIYLRITINKERYQFSTSLRIKPSEWCSNKKRSKKDALLNKQIESYEIETIQIASALRINRSLSIANLRKMLFPQQYNINIATLLDKFRLKKIKQEINHYSDPIYKNILVYLELNKIESIEQINEAFVYNFLGYLQEKSINNGKYRSKHYSYLYNALDLACINEDIRYNPLRKIDKPKFKPEAKQVILTVSELIKFECFIPETQRLKNIKNIFLFQSYTGLSFSDVKAFDKSQIVKLNGQRVIIGNRKKTKVKYTTIYSEKTRNILEEYNFELPKISNQNYNRYLKEIAKKIGIDKKISSHVGRRTFAQLMLNKGMSIEAVSHMIGHSDIKTTQKHYASAGAKLVVNELQRLKSA